nr:hypothetical protein [Candidatus Freyarchaeota archaeon]
MSGVLTGVGFYGMYQAGGGAMGVVGLIFGIIGGTAGSLLLILGNILGTPLTLFASEPNYLFIWIGMIILGVSFILLGVTSRVVRGSTTRPSAAAAAGTLSIIGGCFFFPYILDWLLRIAGGIFTLIAFVLVLSAFIIWAAVFFGSRNF